MDAGSRRKRAARRAFSLKGLRAAALIAVAVAVGGGAAFSAVEKHVSTWDGIYWAFVTMTTVGYGERLGPPRSA